MIRQMSTETSLNGPDDERAVLEGFAIEMGRPKQGKHTRKIVRDILGSGWKIRRFGDYSTDFEIRGQLGALSVQEAWQKTYEIRRQPGVVYAEPLFRVSLADAWEYGLSCL